MTLTVEAQSPNGYWRQLTDSASPLGAVIEDVLFIAEATSISGWVNQIQSLPLQVVVSSSPGRIRVAARVQLTPLSAQRRALDVVEGSFSFFATLGTSHHGLG